MNFKSHSIEFAQGPRAVVVVLVPLLTVEVIVVPFVVTVAPLVAVGAPMIGGETVLGAAPVAVVVVVPLEIAVVCVHGRPALPPARAGEAVAGTVMAAASPMPAASTAR